MNDRLREFLIVFSTTELHCSGFTQECFTKVMSDASLVSAIRWETTFVCMYVSMYVFDCYNRINSALGCR